MDKKRFTPEDMKYINYVTWPAVSEDGCRIAWVTYTGEEENGTFPSRISCIRRKKSDDAAGMGSGEGGADGNNCAAQSRLMKGETAVVCSGWQPEELTGGEMTEGISRKQPLFLADGIHMTYLSDQSGEYQIYLHNLETGSARQITTLRHGILRYTAADDGSRLVFEAVLWPDEIEDGTAFIEMSRQEKLQWQEELEWKPYEITELTYKMDEWHGMRKGEFSHIGVIGLNGDGARIIDTRGMEAVYPAWSHDGRRLAFYGYPYTGANGRRPELFVCEADGSGMEQLTKNMEIYADHAPVFTADDRAVIGMAFPDLSDGSCVLLPYCADTESRSVRFLMDEWDEAVCHGVNPLAAGRLEYGEKTPYFRLTKDGKYLYFISGFRGRTGLYRIAVSDKTTLSKAEQVMRGETDLQEFAMNGQGMLVTAEATWKEPADLYLEQDCLPRGREGKAEQDCRLSAGGGQKHERLTDSNSWLRAYELARVESVEIKSRDQKAVLQYYLVHPAGQEQGKIYPAVLDIKGGPETMYGLAFWHEFQALAGAGMSVIFGNPRGSSGFGRAYCADGVCWKQEAMDDLLQFTEDAVEKGWIDRARIGVTGGSYGGYMTNKLIGRTNVFAAAVTQRCLANTATSYGTGDMGFVSAGEIPKNFRMLDYLTKRARGNIISYIDHFKTPLLILHAYEDYRCGFEQAEQVFVAMKERNPEIPVRLVMFPGENHEMTRTGKLHHQIRHLEEMTEWFKRYLAEKTEQEKGGEADEQ